ncbi:hypothetical protein M23134_04533 [Microscilla marina ATCC 23134]|uniref:Uncharacterized protein n=1 Tax=Microscilla marina ATCC 23134 TaxID=313606 RepID=A1ZWB4_MICM2|nr:hypothetical protein M23134_04533 [Microscilla marina ATCC 23134]
MLLLKILRELLFFCIKAILSILPDDPFWGTIIFLPDHYFHEYVHPVGQISPPWVIFF